MENVLRKESLLDSALAFGQERLPPMTRHTSSAASTLEVGVWEMSRERLGKTAEQDV